MGIILNKTKKLLFSTTLCLLFSLGIVSAGFETELSELSAFVNNGDFQFKEIDEIKALTHEEQISYLNRLFDYHIHQAEFFSAAGLNEGTLESMSLCGKLILYTESSGEYASLGNDLGFLRTEVEQIQNLPESHRKEALFRFHQQMATHDESARAFFKKLLVALEEDFKNIL